MKAFSFLHLATTGLCVCSTDFRKSGGSSHADSDQGSEKVTFHTLPRLGIVGLLLCFVPLCLMLRLTKLDVSIDDYFSC